MVDCSHRSQVSKHPRRSSLSTEPDLCLVFGFFVFVALRFHLQINRNPTPEADQPSNPWRKHIWALYISSVLILIRSIVKAIDNIQGNNGYLLRHEVFVYAFDSALMLVVLVLFNFVHPSEVKAYLRGGKMAKGFRMYGLKHARASSSDSAVETEGV